MIMTQRGGYDCSGGQCSVKLSSRQGQRVAIARVFLAGAPILVLDEATPAVDSDVKAAIQENLRKFMENKRPIAIVSRASTIAALDDLCTPAWKRRPDGFFSYEYPLAAARPAQ